MDVTHDQKLMVKLLHELKNKSESELTPEEKWRLEHIKIHMQHKGHESMHAEMAIILIVTVAIAQVALMHWKRRHYKSYQPVTSVFLWITPLVISLKYFWWRFVFTWLVFSCITGLIFRKSLQKPVHGSTPRLVYKWFYFIHKLTYVLGLIGYVVFMAPYLGVNMLFSTSPDPWLDSGVMFMFYGMYYGVLGRDIAEMCADRIASQIGYYQADGMPTRNLDRSVCAVCGNKLLTAINEEGVLENTYKLSCDHVFHEFCIRGWCIVGKKQTCPYCKEKVDLKKMFRNPWERPHVLFGQLLDGLRWLLAWQPCILLLVHFINWALGLE